jgi:hypothetical protein
MKLDEAKAEAMKIAKASRIPMSVVNEGIHQDEYEREDAVPPFGYCPTPAVEKVYKYGVVVANFEAGGREIPMDREGGPFSIGNRLVLDKDLKIKEGRTIPKGTGATILAPLLNSDKEPRSYLIEFAMPQAAEALTWEASLDQFTADGPFSFQMAECGKEEDAIIVKLGGNGQGHRR